MKQALVAKLWKWVTQSAFNAQGALLMVVGVRVMEMGDRMIGLGLCIGGFIMFFIASFEADRMQEEIKTLEGGRT